MNFSLHGSQHEIFYFLPKILHICARGDFKINDDNFYCTQEKKNKIFKANFSYFWLQMTFDYFYEKFSDILR